MPWSRPRCVPAVRRERMPGDKRCVRRAEDRLLCLVLPYKMSHDAVMQTIQMMGEHVIPAFR